MKLIFATTVSDPVVASRPVDDEPTWLELQRWEDDGGAVLPDATRIVGKARSVISADSDRVAA